MFVGPNASNDLERSGNAGDHSTKPAKRPYFQIAWMQRQMHRGAILLQVVDHGGQDLVFTSLDIHLDEITASDIVLTHEIREGECLDGPMRFLLCKQQTRGRVTAVAATA